MTRRSASLVQRRSVSSQYFCESLEGRTLLSGIAVTVNVGGLPNPQLGQGGQQIVLSADVIPPDGSQPLPTGTIQFINITGNSHTDIGAPVTLAASGTANKATASIGLPSDPPVFPATFEADYSGDANYAAGMGTFVESFTEGYESATFLTLSSNSIAVGGSLTMSATVTNEGANVGTPTGFVDFLQIFGSHTTLLQKVPLQPDGVEKYTTTTLPPGQLQIWAEYSGDGTFLDSVDQQNVTVGNSGSTGITIAHSTLPASVVSGGSVHASVKINLTNSSSATEHGKFTVNLYAAPDGSLDGSQTLLASSHAVKSLANGHSAALSLNLKSLPASLNGTYTILAQVTDPAGGQSVSSSGPTFKAAGPFLAFSESVLSTGLTSADSAGHKTRAKLKLKVTNNGNIPSKGASHIAIYASTTDAASGGTLIRMLSLTISLNPGASKTFSIPLVALPNVTGGNYFIIAQVTDPKGDITSAASSGAMSL